MRKCLLHFAFCGIYQAVLWLCLFFISPSSYSTTLHQKIGEMLYHAVPAWQANPFALVQALGGGFLLRTFFIFQISLPLAWPILDLRHKKQEKIFLWIGFTSLAVFDFVFLCLLWCPPLYVNLFSLLKPLISETHIFYPFSLILLCLHAPLFYFWTKRFGGRAFLICGAFFLLPLLLFILEKTTPRLPLALPKNSILVLMTDSYRADYFNSEKSPKLFDLAQKLEAQTLKGIVPPVESTVPALAAFLTGKLPQELGISNGYSVAKDLRENSLVEIAKREGYCTLGLSTYSNNSISRHNYGFEIERDSIGDYNYKYFTYYLLSRDPLLLSALSFDPYYAISGKLFRSAYDAFGAAPSFSRILRDFHRLRERCGERPIFALFFFHEPHADFPITYPYYLKFEPLQRNFSRIIDFYLKRGDSTLPAEIERFYALSMAQIEAEIANLIAANIAGASDESHTILFTADHGEYLGEADNFLHGMELGPLEAGAAPFVVFGRGREKWRGFAEKYLPSTEVTPFLQSLIQPNITYSPPQTSMLYRETEVWPWDAIRPKSFQSIHYPSAKNGFFQKTTDGFIVMDSAVLEISEYAKQREWRIGADKYELLPQDDKKHILRKNNHPISKANLPVSIQDHLNSVSPKIWKEL